MGSYKDTLNLPTTTMPIGANLPANEPAVYARWHSESFERFRRGAKNPSFVLHDGPPYANGSIHMGHALNKILKDFVVKCHYFNGESVDFIPGWDCHGLPIEQKVKELKLEGDFQENCRKYAAGQIAQQKEQFKKLGVLADWDHNYETMSPDFEQMISDRLKELADTGLLIRRKKPVYWSWAEETALAEAEVEYKDIESTSVWVIFEGDISLLVWTTTPWTLTANVAVAYNPELDYVLCHGDEGPLAMTVEASKQFEMSVLRKMTKEDFEGLLVYSPLRKRNVPVVPADYVTADKGTGFVHIAPGHGEEDYLVGLKYNLPVDMFVSPDGKITEGELKGEHVFGEANEKIIHYLISDGSFFFSQGITHSYPHSWRSHKPLIFRATDQWFLDLDMLRERALGEIGNTEFIPENNAKRLETMVENRPDWCVSRQRTWGVPILGGPDILDVWFDSGLTWNILNGEHGRRQADVYLEGNDQHRGWFQSSLWLSVALQNQAPFKKVVTHGFVLYKGEKMSKSRGNVMDPLKVVQRDGAEILRYWVAISDYSKDLHLSDEILRRCVDGYKKLRNTIRFLVANTQNSPETASPEPIDLWIYEKSRVVFDQVHQKFMDMAFHEGMQILMNYITSDLSSVYMNAVKDRLYCSGANSVSRQGAVYVMRKILRTLTALIAPLFTYTAHEVCIHADDFERDVFNLVYESLPKMECDFDSDFWLAALSDFHAEFERLKQQGIVRETLEVTVESETMFLGIDDWFVVSKARPGDTLAEFSTKGKKFTIHRSPQGKCDRCWKRAASDNLCPRCKQVVSV